MKTIEIYFSNNSSKTIDCEENKIETFKSNLQNNRFIEVGNCLYNTSYIDIVKIYNKKENANLFI